MSVPAVGTAVTFLTWNLQRATADRVRRQAAWLRTQDADVLVLTEVGPGGRTALPDELEPAGYTLLGLENSASGAGVVLAARLGQLVEAPDLIGTMRHRCEAALLRLGDRSVAVVGLYVPSRGGPRGRNVAKREFQSAVAASLPRIRSHFGCPIVIAGDLNVVEPGHFPHHRVYGQWEYDFYRSFGSNGFVDAFRSRHPTAAEHSWFGRRSGAGYRFDHVFCSADQLPAVSAVGYRHEPRRSGLSDHSALSVRLHLR